MGIETPDATPEPYPQPPVPYLVPQASYMVPPPVQFSQYPTVVNAGEVQILPKVDNYLFDVFFFIF